MSFIDAIYKSGGQLYEVGGTVRDSILGRPHKDRDFVVCHIAYSELKKILKKFGSVLEVGKSFGVIKFRPKENNETLDIALPRSEKSTGIGHNEFDVNFDESLPIELDLKRRDFTINSMAKEVKTAKIIDPFGGREDLKNGVLRQVFENTFLEDPLRLLRAVQFSSRFNLRVEANTLAAMSQHASKIKTVSAERIVEEIGKLLTAEKPSQGFYLMKETGILKHVFPMLEKNIGVKQPAKRCGDVFDHSMIVLDAARKHPDVELSGDLEIMFTAIFHDVGKAQTQAIDPQTGRITFHGHQFISKKMTQKWLQQFPIQMLGINPKHILILIENHMFETKSFFSDKAIRRFIRKIGPELIFKLLDFRIADKKGGAYPNKFYSIVKLKERIREEIDRKPPFSPKDLAINGHDLMKLGYSTGPQLGKVIEHLVEFVLDEPKNNQASKLKEEALKKFPLEN